MDSLVMPENNLSLYLRIKMSTNHYSHILESSKQLLKCSSLKNIIDYIYLNKLFIWLYLFRIQSSNDRDKIYVMLCIKKRGYEVDKTNIFPQRWYKNHHIILKIMLLLPQAINSKNLIKKALH